MRARQACHAPGCPEPALVGRAACKKHLRVTGQAWLELARAAIDAYDGLCARCPSPATSVNHRRPVGLGGDPMPALHELEPVCDDCREAADAEAHRAALRL